MDQTESIFEAEKVDKLEAVVSHVRKTSERVRVGWGLGRGGLP